jgi:hypothetical protein
MSPLSKTKWGAHIMKKVDKNQMKQFLDELRSSKKGDDDSQTVEPIDRDLTMRIAEAICDVLDLQGAMDNKERSEVYGYRPMKDRISQNKHKEESMWAMNRYQELSLEESVSINRSIMGTLLLRTAENMDHLISYVSLLGFDSEDAALAVGKTVWSHDQGQYVRSSTATCMTYGAGVFSYVVLALEDKAIQLFGDDSIKMATDLRNSLGGLNDYGEPECFGFNRGWVFAKTIAENIEHRARGRKSKEQAEADMQVGTAPLRTMSK